ncbi:hypothetical protein [Sphingobacterium sp. SGR-19]|uniref:hypothetical protein n=1 Tax=Sphingobacterium sp. SGR-19 TaxID=2710886 RepID=UPI0013EA7EAE|nr:hypothetical protein [Sphingobacterium sp. SGR-19]NGM64707.1 hypothetical protein [Sphingobacterium sp. SGR-19]
MSNINPFLRTALIMACCTTLCYLYTGCIGSKYGSKKKAERHTAALTPEKEVITYAMVMDYGPQAAYWAALGRGEPARGLLPGTDKLISLATDGIHKLIENDKKKYQADYSFALNDMYFYDKNSTNAVFDPIGMQFTGFEVTRTFANAEGQTDTAMHAVFEPILDNPEEIYQNAIFRLKLKEIKLNYAKAKVPFNNGKKLNLDFEISLYTSYVSQQGTLNERVKLGTFIYSLRDAPLDKSDDGYAIYYARHADKPCKGQSFIVPRSYSYYLDEAGEPAHLYSRGLYSIVVKVKESSKDVFVNKILMENSGVLIDAAGKGIKSLQ